MSRQVGIMLFEYHEMTPLELNLCVTAVSDKMKIDQESELFLSYINAYWQRVETLKSFEDMIGKEKKAKAMSPEEMLSKVMGLHTELGGTTQQGIPQESSEEVGNGCS